jgi:hypothetical protein
MNKRNGIRIIHKQLCVDPEMNTNYMLIIECDGNTIKHIYKVVYPEWFKYFDSTFKYHPINFN